MEWFKVNGFNLIYGSLRLDPPIHQLAFIKLLALASVSRVPGVVCIADKVPYPLDVLATTLGIPQDELQKAIDYNVLPEQDRLKINEWGGIEITKWAEYQSKSYLRVRKHREKKRIEENRKEESVCNASVTSCNNDVTMFDTFWEKYPRKVGKGDARKSFEKISPDSILLDKILAAIENQKNNPQWLKDKGQYIPHPTTWLNQERWLDEVDVKIRPVVDKQKELEKKKEKQRQDYEPYFMSISESTLKSYLEDKFYKGIDVIWLIQEVLEKRFSKKEG